MAESPAMPVPLPEAIGWVGSPLAALEGGDIGKVQSVYIDATDHHPSWLVAKLAGSGRRERGARVVAVPVDVCGGAAGAGVWAAIDESSLRDAPVVDPARPLLREHELTICKHFGITDDVGRAAAVREMAFGAVTSIPPRG